MGFFAFGQNDRLGLEVSSKRRRALTLTEATIESRGLEIRSWSKQTPPPRALAWMMRLKVFLTEYNLSQDRCRYLHAGGRQGR